MVGQFIAVGIGGFIGTCLRFLFTKLWGCLGFSFPFGTLTSNIVASLAIGFIIGFEQQTFPLSSKAKLFLATGVLGGLSTFSTFSLETVSFFMDGKYLIAVGNITLNLVLSLVCVVIGMTAARLVFAKA